MPPRSCGAPVPVVDRDGLVVFVLVWRRVVVVELRLEIAGVRGDLVVLEVHDRADRHAHDQVVAALAVLVARAAA
ncbi:MAG: hypothetical protein U0168_28750 [Nannocystaceae bacterium]